MPDHTVSGPESVPQVASQSKDPVPNALTKTRPKRRRRRNKSPVYAALDLGTNNCRLLIARPHNDRFRVIDSYSKVVRLGKGLAHTGELSPESMDDAVEALRVSARKMAERRVTKWRCVATQAMRQATNGEAFLKRVKEETGVTLEVISPRVEARLSVMGCLNLIDTEKDVVPVSYTHLTLPTKA